MSTSKNYARIAITLPEKDLAAADRLAKVLDRSRSWVIAEAVRRFSEQEERAVPRATAVSRVAEPVAQDGTAPSSGLSPLRLEQLRQDSALTPEQRVREAEETLRLDEVIARRDRKPRFDRILTFARLEDYVDWKRHQDRLA